MVGNPLVVTLSISNYSKAANSSLPDLLGPKQEIHQLQLLFENGMHWKMLTFDSSDGSAAAQRRNDAAPPNLHTYVQMRDATQRTLSNAQFDGLIVIFSGYSTRDGSKFIFGTAAHTHIAFNDIISAFSDTVRMPWLIDSPKLFIFDTCRIPQSVQRMVDHI